ncbi:transglycosylase domain-containing protein [Laceyella putida]|uniref:Transglycosylase domain-containing protein n=1 Tax=Laceyella putida TaxID=110101 RepID=A0ABW2RK03_9BACL
MDKHLLRRSRKSANTRVFKKVFTALYIFFAVLLICVTAGIGVGAGIVSAMVKDEQIRNKEDFQKDLDSLFQNSYAYFQTKDEQGQPLRIGAFRSGGDMRKLIQSKDDVSKYLVDAFISVEDRDFYEHNGIVPRSLLRASFQQLTNSEVTTGGSTITQQLVKNVILKDFDKDLERKAKEIVLAIRLDAMYEKDEILTYYMNSVFFGNGANKQRLHGVQAAAKGLFDVDAKDLNLAQSAYIAGMVQRPNDYNPFGGDKNLERGKKRMKLVLDKMLENKKITKKEYDEALTFDIKKSLAKPDKENNSYANYSYIMYALEEEAAEILMKQDGLDIDELSKQGKYRATLNNYIEKVLTRGYHVYSTINKPIYDAVNAAASKGLVFHSRTYRGVKEQEQLGAVVMDNRTGSVLAFVPTSNNKGKLNHALNAYRQPGSSIKPLIVYGPAMEEGVVSPSTLVLDEKYPKADGSGYYENAADKYYGPVSVTKALTYSFNIPAIKVFNKMGHEVGFDYLRKLNIPPHKNDGEAAAIGGQYRGYTVDKITAAFATFANEGKYNSPHLVDKITDASGKVVYEHKAEQKQVFSPQTSYQMIKILRTVVTQGTGVFIGSRIYGYDIAGKTGTTSDDKDSWFIGSTPNITIGAWGGYDHNFSMKHNDKFTKRAWVNIFKAAAEAAPQYFDKKARFQSPGGLRDNIACLDCDAIDDYLAEQKKKEEEEQKKKQQPPQPGQPGDQPIDLPPIQPGHQPGGRPKPTFPPPPPNQEKPRDDEDDGLFSTH